jgi:hypothetical protein
MELIAKISSWGSLDGQVKIFQRDSHWEIIWVRPPAALRQILGGSCWQTSKLNGYYACNSTFTSLHEARQVAKELFQAAGCALDNRYRSVRAYYIASTPFILKRKYTPVYTPVEGFFSGWKIHYIPVHGVHPTDVHGVHPTDVHGVHPTVTVEINWKASDLHKRTYPTRREALEAFESWWLSLQG